jgi:hypothetical protein
MAVTPDIPGAQLALLPRVVQKANAVTSAAGKTLTCAFANANNTGNSIIVVLGMGEVEGAGIVLAVTDSNSNTYTEAVKGSQSTTLEATIFYATGIVAGTNTITITLSGGSSSNTAIAVEVYEVSGLIAVTPGALDATNTGTNAGSTSVTTSAVVPLIPNELAFIAIASAGTTITAGTNWVLDSGTLAPTGGNLTAFGSESQLLTTTASVSGAATLSGSSAWASAIATFKTPILPVEATVGGTVNIGNANANGQNTMGNSAPVVIASDQSPVKVRPGFLEIAGQGPGVVNAINTDLIPSTDISDYNFISLQLTGTWSGILTFQGSNDGATFTSTLLSTLAPNAVNFAQTTTLNNIFVGARMTRYLRVRMTTFTSNASLAGTLELYSVPPPMFSTYIAGQATVLPGNTQNTTPWLVNTPSSDLTVLASAAQTTTQTQADQTNNTARGIIAVLDMTTIGTGSVTLEIDGKDIASGKYYALLTGAAVVSNSTNVYTCFPGATAAANVTANAMLPHTWRIKVTANNANSATYSVGASLLP